MRGFTTQKRVSSTRWGLASLTSSAVAMTSFRSGESATDLTTPICTSLYFSLVLPASMPSALLKRMVMVGPRSSTAFTPSQPASSAATKGTSHTAGSDQRARLAATASGVSAGCMALRVPDEARIETHRRQHGEHHDRGEGKRAGPGVDRRQGLRLDERDQDRGHIDVEHRPASDQLDDAVEARALARLPGRAQLDRRGEKGERRHLQQRHADARDEDHERERPRPGRPQVDDAAQDGVVLRSREPFRMHDRQYVRGDVQDGGRNEKGPGAAQAVRLASLHSPAARYAAAQSRTSAPRAQAPMSGVTVAMWASFARDTNRPSTKTSSMDHGCAARSVCSGAGAWRRLGCWRSAIDVSATSGKTTVVATTSAASGAMPSSYKPRAAPSSVACTRFPWTSSPTIGKAMATAKALKAASMNGRARCGCGAR